jgi:transposase
MPHYAALDVSQETTCVCLVDETGRVIGETKLPTCPDAIAAWLGKRAVDLTRVGLETGPMAVWLWNELHARGLPVICIDARHAHAALKVRPNKTDRNDAAGLAQVVRTGWFKQVQIKTRASYEVRSLLTARDALIQIRVKLENEIRGLLRTFGIVFGKAAGGFSRRADELVAGELEASPPMRRLVETLLQTRGAVLDQIKVLDGQLTATAKIHPVARLFMTAPGVGAITALSVASAFDQAERFRRSSSAGAYLGLTPRRYESGEVSHNGRISKHGSALTHKHLSEAATTLLTRTTRFSRLKAWGLRLAKASGFKKARVAVARKLAVILHAMWKTQTPFRWGEAVA